MAESLREWYINYVKNRDIMLRKIATLDTLSENISITYKDSTIETALIAEAPASFVHILQSLGTDQKIAIATLNKNENISLMISEWDKLATFKGLTIMFVNQNSSTDKRWVIKPYVHNGVTEKPALKLGIMSIASNVELC